jgi:YcaO-like protein with predicted kinase domain
MASDASLTAADPLGLDEGDLAVKGFFDGTHRLISPERTLERMRPLMPVMGITRLAVLTGLDIVGLPVVMAVRPNARSLAVSSGKGLTLAAAMASALMEAIELYHAERVSLPLLLSTHREMRCSHAVVDLDRLPRLSVSRFHDDRPILWAEGFDLLSRESKWLPFELVHSNFSLPFPAGSGCFPMNSNGLASGNHVLEAVSHGLCEVVERDALALWHRRSIAWKRRHRLDLRTITDMNCVTALDRLDAAGLDAGVWNITSDLGVPAFECLIVDRDPQVFQRAYATSGSGCHPDRDTALLRAITEAAQGRMIYIAGSRDDRDRDAYEEASDPNLVQGVRSEIAATSGPQQSFRAAPTSSQPTFAQDVRWQLDRLRAAGVDEVLVIDLARPEFQVPVVRVIVPGLEGVDGAPGYVEGPRARAVSAS